MFTETLFTIAEMWKQPKGPLVDEWINKMLSIHTMEHYSAIKRNTFLIYVTTWMKLENMLNEINQAQKDKYCYDSTHTRNLE